MRPLICLLVLVPWTLFAQSDRSFKAFFKEGLAFYEQGEYEQALAKFKQAYRLEPTPKKIKMEGTFFEPYLPRHRIGLCLEHLDILEADAWIKESLTALELNVLKKRDLIAAYREDVERIQKNAEKKREELETAYQLALSSAQNLLESEKFDQAEAAFQQLYENNPKRPEAAAGLNNVAFARNAFIDNKVLEIEVAVARGDLERAAELLGRIESVDPSHPEIPVQRSRIETAAAGQKAEARPAPPEPKPTVTRRDETKPAASNAEQERSDRTDSQADTKRQVRQALLDALAPYQHGNPELALEKLDQIEVPNIEKWGSYHWLKSVFLLAKYRNDGAQDAQVYQEARNNMARAIELIEDFSVDPDLYPDDVMKMVAEITQDAQP